MTNRSGNYHQVPGEVGITHLMCSIETDTARVGNAARNDPGEARQRNPMDYLRRCNYHQPAHYEIEHNRKPAIASAEDRLHRQANDCQTPPVRTASIPMARAGCQE